MKRRTTRSRLVGSTPSDAVPVQPTASRRPDRREREQKKIKRTAKVATRQQQHDREQDRARGQHRQPALTPATAADVAKLLMAGVPFLSVLALCDNDYATYIAGHEDGDRRDALTTRWALAWQRDPQLLAAMSDLNGADWQELEPERRLQIALDKHMAELAYFLYEHNYDSLMGRDVDKADHAREAIMEFLAAKGGDPDAPWMKHLKDLVERVGADNAVPMLTVPTVKTATGKQES